MADAVTSQVIDDGERNYVVKLTNVSDGTGETDVKKVDISTLHPVPTSVSLLRVEGSINGMTVRLKWDASSKVDLITLAEKSDIDLDFRDKGGIVNNAGAGKTGNVYLSTIGAANNSTYSLILHFKKKYLDGSHS